jgi:iron(III) transport system permease protein
VTLPLISLALWAFRQQTARLLSLFDAELVALAARTLLLAGLATLWAAALGLTLAWLVVRTDLPGRSWVRWLAALPLAIPSYIGALTYITLLEPTGPVNRFLDWLIGQGPLVNIYGFWGGVFVLGLFTYPLLFVLVAGSLEVTDPAYEEAARSLGQRPRQVLWSVTLPLVKPSITAGALLVFLYSASDFGSLSLLRVRVFTTEIFHQLNTRFDPGAAALLALVLVIITGLVLLGQRKALGARYFTQVSSASRPAPRATLGRWRLPAAGLVVTIMALTLVLPVMVLVSDIPGWGSFWVSLVSQGRYIWNSLAASASAASLGLVLGYLVAYTAQRKRVVWGKGVYSLTQMGYALPGTVLGLGMILFYNNYLPWIYGSWLIVVIGYLVRFSTQTVQASRSSLEGIHPHLEEAARSLGLGPAKASLKVIIPNIRAGLLAGWALFFISAMKELDATLLLRPAGFDTLPVRIYVHTLEADFASAALVALVQIIITAIPLSLLLGRRERKMQLS